MSVHIKPRAATVVLYQGDDLDRLGDLKRTVTVAERIAEAGTGTERLGDDDTSVIDAQVAFDAFLDEAAERALTIEIRSIGRRRFRDLLVEHPARKVTEGEGEEAKQVDHPDDAGYGVNVEIFPEALLSYRDGDVVTIAQPEFATAADCKRFLDDELAEGDFDQLWLAAYMLNRSPSSDPKSLRFSTITETSDETTT